MPDARVDNRHTDDVDACIEDRGPDADVREPRGRRSPNDRHRPDGPALPGRLERRTPMDIQINPESIAPGLTPDLVSAVSAIRQGRARASELLQASEAAADDPACAHAFIRRFTAQARATAQGTDLLRQAGGPLPPLAGLAVSIKDLFDVQGQQTTAGAQVLADAPTATADCTAVARLRRAGAALVGHTNLSEFAYSGIGLNPHHGTPANPTTARLNPTPRVPGGSTSGGAVSVACGAAWAALGSDTGGSIRIPAALQGLVGFKNTQALTPRDGCIPLSPTLDTTCAITRSVRDAVLLHAILADRRPRLSVQPLAALRLAVPHTLMLDGLDSTVAQAFEQTLRLLRDAGAHLHEIALPELGELAGLQAQGGFAAAESWAWHRARLADPRQAERYDPRVAQRIRRGESISAADYIDLGHQRRDWITRVERAIAGCDALLSPTVPMVAPVMAPLLSSDPRFFAINALLLRNPSVINLLDGCATSLPCHAPDQLPVGLMVWGPAGADDRVLSVSLAIEALLHRTHAAGPPSDFGPSALLDEES
jgi:aspartyl-tRNA(Asn)/glutamyl-tRNA(Gln) amidotransferase subunit A